MRFWFKPGHWIEWASDAAAGEVEIALSYSDRDDTRREVKVNGQLVLCSGQLPP